MKKILFIITLSVLIILSSLKLELYADYSDEVNAKSAVLMEASTGMVLYEKNSHEALPPASVTKIMTLLLVMEAVYDNKITLEEMVTVSEYAASMGGSQVFLEPGEQMSVNDMIKSVVVSSANDAAVALAEHIAGSEASFVKMMNDKAKALGMSEANFENTNGLDDTSDTHLCSAMDIAIMSRALLSYEKILEYTTIWQDTIRDGQFTLSNTNRLIRFYNGANGLKTGSTSKAKFCISATAKRDDMQLICVIMGAETRDIRNQEAKKLLDYGFANYGVFKYEQENIGSYEVIGGVGEKVELLSDQFNCILDKSKLKKVEKHVQINEQLSAPINTGDKIGEITFTVDGEVIGISDIKSITTIKKITYSDILIKIISKFASIF